MAANIFQHIGLFSKAQRFDATVLRAKDSGEESGDQTQKDSGSTTSFSNPRFFMFFAPKEIQSILHAIYRDFGMVGLNARKCLLKLDPSKPEDLLELIRSLCPTHEQQMRLAQFLLDILKSRPEQNTYQKVIEALEKMLAPTPTKTLEKVFHPIPTP